MFLRLTALGLALLSPLAAQAQAAAQPLAPKVMVITMFGGETKPWLANLDLPVKVAVPGLPADTPEVSCNGDLCVMTTAMGFANAASSTMAVALSDRFDLSKTYFIVAGIAGIDPANGTLGSAAWADYVVDAGLSHQIDSREAPPEWKSEIVELGAKAPGEKPKWSAGTEVYKLNPALVAAALEASKGVALADSDGAKAYRAAYAEATAKAAPSVTVCATASGDTYWHGAVIGEQVAAHVALLTDGKADYCTTQMEDNATLTALKRGAGAGRLDLARVAVLRTASNFDRAHPGQTAAESLASKSGGFGPATENAFRVGHAFAQKIIADWKTFGPGLPD